MGNSIPAKQFVSVEVPLRAHSRTLLTDNDKAKLFLDNNPGFVGADGGFVLGTTIGNAYDVAKNNLMENTKVLQKTALVYTLQKSYAGVQLL